MGITLTAFNDGDVYIDYPYEEVMFRYEKSTQKVFRKFYGSSIEDEIPHNLNIYVESIIAGKQVSLVVYNKGKPRHSNL